MGVTALYVTRHQSTRSRCRAWSHVSLFTDTASDRCGVRTRCSRIDRLLSLLSGELTQNTQARRCACNYPSLLPFRFSSEKGNRHKVLLVSSYYSSVVCPCKTRHQCKSDCKLAVNLWPRLFSVHSVLLLCFSFMEHRFECAASGRCYG